MINGTELKEKQTGKILQRIGCVVLVIGLYAGLCVLFFTYSKFEDAQLDMFIASTICFLFGLLYVIIPIQFFKVFYKFGTWVLSKSIHEIESVSEKKGS